MTRLAGLLLIAAPFAIALVAAPTLLLVPAAMVAVLVALGVGFRLREGLR